ncbi:predicted protein [Histoplasma mississippiense (nom. inval.)]|uniref:predicted protein n=1 Tax=Ajellomyces capsulatus (strain NAm1 / WU24) TaxID=2059318 RepID=UPI000157B5EE|nr:predicted protein [Histoplasma mississippiense (nom. inval.)]EDN02431.1 predicted protein [Histoplasma mississippiense (nom. inval.)]
MVRVTSHLQIIDGSDLLMSLQQHKRSHEPRNLECFGCDYTFASFSAMLLHLESGTCASGVDVDYIDELAFECYQSPKYSDNVNDDFPFFCLICGSEFGSLSGLFQHSETTLNCRSNTTDRGCLAKLRHFMRMRLT